MLQSVELVLNFLATGVERAGERRIDGLQLVSQAIELVVNVFFGGGEALRRARAEVFFDDSLYHRFGSFEEIGEREPVSFEHAAPVAFDHGQTRTRQNRRRGPFEHAIDFGGLRKVGDLGGAAVVSEVGNR